MDIRTFFGCPKTKINCMYCIRKAGGAMVVGVSYGTCKGCAKRWKQSLETPHSPPDGLSWWFECSLGALIKNDVVMEANDDDGFELFTRVPTEEEWAKVQFSGPVLRLPYNWGWDYPMVDGRRKFHEIQEHRISNADWEAGQRWTMRKCVDTMRKFYGANKNRKARSLGDHQFFEGFCEDGQPYFGS